MAPWRGCCSWDGKYKQKKILVDIGCFTRINFALNYAFLNLTGHGSGYVMSAWMDR